MADALFMTALSPPLGIPIPTASSTLLDANNDGVGWAFQANVADPITHLGFRYTSRTGTPPTYRISLQSTGVADGLPDGTVLGGGTPASATFTPPADATWDGTWRWITLDNAYTPTRGQILAACIEYSSGTVDASNFSSITRTLQMNATGMPYGVIQTAGTWAKNNSGVLFGYRTASGRYGVIALSEYVTNTVTAGHRSAMHFTLPAGHGDTFKLAGIHSKFRAVLGQTQIVGVWNAAGTLLQSVTIDHDQFNPLSSQMIGEVYFADTTLATLEYGTKYYVGFESIGGSSIGVRGLQLAEAEDRGAWPLGTVRGLSNWDTSVWTDDNTVMPWMQLIFADITEPSGGGGGPVPRFGRHGDGPAFRGAA